jgi:hypothetical protein
MYLFLSLKIMLLRLKIPLPEEEVASSSEPTFSHPNLVKLWGDTPSAVRWACPKAIFTEAKKK